MNDNNCGGGGFNGTVNVDSDIAMSTVLECICYIERKRNKIFKDYVDSYLDDPPTIKWWMEDYNFKGHWGRSYISNLTKREVLDAFRNNNWLSKEWNLYMKEEYKCCTDIMRLVPHHHNIWITPEQALIINRALRGDYKK